MPAVRQALLARQRAFRRPPGLVADGRDMGTVVFPDADLKVFLTASPEVRAERRYKQLIEKGIDANLRALSRDLAERDERDANRAVAPLVPAADSQVLDSSALSIDEVVERIVGWWRDGGKWVAIAERWPCVQPGPWAQACGLKGFFFLNGKHFPSTAVPEVVAQIRSGLRRRVVRRAVRGEPQPQGDAHRRGHHRRGAHASTTTSWW